MKTHEVLKEIATFKENDDYEGFQEFIESLTIIELTSLQRFSSEIKSFCEKQIANYI